MYPDVLNKNIEYLKKFDGIGEKTAERLALSILNMNKDDILGFANNIIELSQNIVRCKICGHISEKEICNICSDSQRSDNIICVVEDYKTIFRFENTGNFEGKYHVLNGVISPIDGITPDDLNIDSLIERIKNLKNDNDIEIIIALKPSIEGETTTLYLKKILDPYKVKITRLSYGIPIGVDMDYLDTLTLDRALKDRKDI